MMHLVRRFTLLALLAALLLSGCAKAPERSETEAPTPSVPTGNPLTGLEIMDALQIGWNLGNSFDAPDGELAWANPFTTPELLSRVKELGFSSIRIPISWGKHVSPAPDYTIDEAFLTRVDTVVNQALDAGLYVIIDAHHDNGIYFPTPDNAEQGKAYLSAIWTQIGTHFRDADYRLLFQTMNEPRVEGTSYEWGLNPKLPEHQEIFGVIDELNQTALSAIRASGGKNADRFVIVCPYAGKVDSTAPANFHLPQDSADGKLMVSVHIYTPYNLCLNLDPQYHTYSAKDSQEIRFNLERLRNRFLFQGIPVVIDEMGCTEKDNPDDRCQWAKDFTSLAREYGVPCLWWDNGYLHGDGDNFGMINRKTLELYPESQSVYDGLFEGLKAE